MENDIFFINTPVDIQEEIYPFIEKRIEERNIPENKTVYLNFVTNMNMLGRYYFQVYLTDGIVEHSTLNYPADFLIFLK